MENIALQLVDNVPSIVAIIIGVCGFVWLMFQTMVKKFLEERVSQGFKIELSRLELSHRNKFSLADEMRKSIYDINRYMTEIVVFYHFHFNPDIENIDEKEFWKELKDQLYGLSTSWEKLNLLHIDFLQHQGLQYKLADRFKAIGEVAKTYSDDDNQYQYVKAEIDKLELVEIAELRIILNGYLMEISE